MSHKMMLLLLISMTTIAYGQNPQQQDTSQQQSGSCSCPCQSTILTGPPGPTGYPGVQGPQGVTGPMGNSGTNGLPGVPGQNGNPGIKGDRGEVGQGSKGDRGDSGEPGPKGEQGSSGNPGKVGPVGITGLQGAKGDEGQMGVKGEPGTGSGTSYSAPPMSAFSARVNGRSAISSGSVVTFDHEDLDIGDDFNPGTGVFTCPIEGLYYFSFNFLPDYRDNFFVLLQQNGNSKAKIYYSSGSSYMMQSQSIILSLQVGDEVKLVAEGSVDFDHISIANNFNGYLIHVM